MLPLIMAACGAAGAVAGVVATCAVKEKDKQAIKRYEKVNAELINSRDQLQQRYYELADKSKQQINQLNLKLIESELEKDLIYLALELYQELMELREDIDINPSFEVLVEFHKAIVLTNYVLKQLDRRLVPVSQDFFSRTLNRIDERDNLSKDQLISFMAVLMNPQQETVTYILNKIQNEMFSHSNIKTKESNVSFDKNIPVINKIHQEEHPKLSNENQWIQTKNAEYREVFVRVKEIVVKELEVEECTVTPETNFVYDLGIDYCYAMNFLMAVAEEFDIEIPDEVAEQLDAVGEVVDYIVENVEFKYIL